MRCYVTSRFKNAVEERDAILALCSAVKSAGYEDVSFIRDIEQFNPRHFTTQQEVWTASLELLKTCDCLLIDISDHPSGGRIVEAGMAFALGLPIFVIAKQDTEFKKFYEGIATDIIHYSSYADVTSALAAHVQNP